MKKFSVGKTQVYDILKDKDKLVDQWKNCSNGSIKRQLRHTGNEDINNLLWEWFVAARAKNHRLSGPMLQEYAREIARKLGNNDFKASNGWLESFRKRHQIVFNEVCGESNDVSEETIAEWKSKLSTITEGYESCNIANGDEHFMVCQPSKCAFFLRGYLIYIYYSF